VSDPTRLLDPTRPGRRCEEHGKTECVKRRKGGGVCHGAAVAGTDACRMHGGQRGDVLKAKGEALSAWRAVPGRSDISPSEAVMSMLQMSWARVHLYASLLERQLAGADRSRGVGEGEGLVGHTFSASPSVGVYESGEAVRGLAVLEERERDRCVRYAKVAHDMGIADREIRLAEQQGALLAGAINRILDALELSPAQRGRVPDIVPGILLEVAGEGAS
jgi:hypothetical protein